MSATLERILKIVGAILTFAAVIKLPLPLKVWVAGIVFLCWVGFEIFTFFRKKKETKKTDQKKQTRTIRFSMLGVILIIILAALFGEYVLPKEPSAAESMYYMLVLDASENMNQPFEGGTIKWDEVQDAFQGIYEDSYTRSNYGLVLIGGQNPMEKSSDLCSMPTVPLIPLVAENGRVLPQDELSPSNLNEQFQGQHPQGGGSLRRAFSLAKNQLVSLPLDKIKVIVLIVNASDTCEKEIDWDALASSIQLVNETISVHKELILIDTTGNEDVKVFAKQWDKCDQAVELSQTCVEVPTNHLEFQESFNNVLDRLKALTAMVLAGEDPQATSESHTPPVLETETQTATISGGGAPSELDTVVPTKNFTATSVPTFTFAPILLATSAATSTATSTYTPTPSPPYPTSKPTKDKSDDDNSPPPTKDNPTDVPPPPTQEDPTDVPPPTTDPCCRHCGANSQPCGDSCISLEYECHQPPGCACK